MKIINYGSLNIDYVYNVNHIVTPGETIDSLALGVYPGGKGLNQSLAMARAGASVYHAGLTGEDGSMLVKMLKKDGVECRYVRAISQNTGSAFIQVDATGQNSIVLNGGANRSNSKEWVNKVLSGFSEGDVLLLQNEINCIDYIIDTAYTKKMFIILNPSPMNKTIKKCDLHKVAMLIMNEKEGQQITGERDIDSILAAIKINYPDAKVALTLGESGAVYQDSVQTIRHGAYKVAAVDTTAAGDTFTGYFIAVMMEKRNIIDCLEISSKAAALAVMKKGAASSIPYLNEVLAVDLGTAD